VYVCVRVCICVCLCVCMIASAFVCVCVYESVEIKWSRAQCMLCQNDLARSPTTNMCIGIRN